VLAVNKNGGNEMKVSELTGALLDYWVGQAEGKESYIYSGYCFLPNPHREPGDADGNYQPSTNWKQAGPIIERENIQLGPPTQRVHRNGGPHAGWGASGIWSACTWHKGANDRRAIAHHETSPLIAAMRCYVASKYGEEVPESIAAA
jgi:hypothetical protein